MQDFESDLTSLSGKRDYDRRQMLATSLAVGFAAAVQPVCAQTAISTNTNGLTAGEVRIPVSDGEIPAYRAMPDKGGPFPLILVVQEIFGVHEHIKDICRRLAKQGYMAIAAELYARQGNVAGMTDIQEIISKVVSKVPDAQVMSDLDAIVAYAKASGSADTARLGITGFCWGGRITWLYAEHTAGLKAGVAWYGKLAGDPSPQTPKHPLDLAVDLKAPVLGLYGPPTRAFRSIRSSACMLLAKLRARLANSSSIRTPRTPSTPTTGRATAKARPRTPGHACLPGSVRTVSSEHRLDLKEQSGSCEAVNNAPLVVRAGGVQAGGIAKIRTPSKLVAEQSGDVEKDDHDDWHAEQPENDAFHESLQLAPPLKNDSSLAKFRGLQWLMSTRDSRRAAAFDHAQPSM